MHQHKFLKAFVLRGEQIQLLCLLPMTTQQPSNRITVAFSDRPIITLRKLPIRAINFLPSLQLIRLGFSRYRLVVRTGFLFLSISSIDREQESNASQRVT